MIRLEFMQKSLLNREKEVEAFCVNLYHSIQKKRREELDEWSSKYLPIGAFIGKKKVSEFPFLEIMIADFKTLCKLRRHLRKRSINMEKDLKKYLIDTAYKKINHKEFTQILGGTVCPYCNRNYINSTNSSTTSQFDHFFNKDKFPIFAVSFYNLIPVCPSCNRIKHVHDLSYSPYDESVSPDQMYSFNYYIKGIGYMRDCKQMKIIIDEKAASKMRRNKEILKLEALYQIHGDVVVELLKKKHIYTREYLMYIKNRLNLQESDIKRIITFAYTDEVDYGKRTLSKFITDISKNIKLI
ncbi:hypothetical protein [Azotosporobacter soli]|uniref:hypothetical protein n=1 Tax=Azotosporobacter soli TaxID=3055040 RepID=UPI0031FE9E0F